MKALSGYGRRSRLGYGRRSRLGGCAIAVLAAGWVLPATAVVIELKDVASDRVERQRAEAIGELPLPGTPNVGQLAERLAEKHMAMGNHILIRVFKASSELELWMKTGDRYALFATYPICNWSGTLGPKIVEGDKQSPEGVYTVASHQLHLVGRHPRSLNLGFPNALDRQMNRTGSYILIHGGCSSVGCFAMTNPVIEEVYSLALAAVTTGKQDAFQVQVYPFRMTEERLRAYGTNEWYDFWRNLKDVSDSFERTHLPPRISICEGRYWVEDETTQEEVAAHGPLAVCAVSQAEAAFLRNPGVAMPGVSLPVPQPVPQPVTQPVSLTADERPWWPLRAMVHPALIRSTPSAPMVHSPQEKVPLIAPSLLPFDRALSNQQMQALLQQYLTRLPVQQRLHSKNSNPRDVASTATLAMTLLARTGRFATPGARSPNDLGSPSVQLTAALPCSQIRASCRHWVAAKIATGQWPPRNRRLAHQAVRTRTAAHRTL